MTADPPTDSSASIATAEPTPEPKSPYPPAAATPVLIGPEGIRFDFNLGCRVVLPPRTEGKWRIRLRDLDTGNILFESENKGASSTPPNAGTSASGSRSGRSTTPGPANRAKS